MKIFLVFVLALLNIAPAQAAVLREDRAEGSAVARRLREGAAACGGRGAACRISAAGVCG